MVQPIAVIGGGHAGHCMAGDLTLAGHDVIFCAHPGAHAAFDESRGRGQIELVGRGRTGIARPEFTTDIADALGRARLLHMLLPAIRHLELFEALAPHLRDDHQIVLWSGNFGSLRLAELLRARSGPRPLIAEASTVPYSTRLRGPGRVHIQALASLVLLAALPATRTAEIVDACAPLWPAALWPAVHVLQAAFSYPKARTREPARNRTTRSVNQRRAPLRSVDDRLVSVIPRARLWRRLIEPCE